MSEMTDVEFWRELRRHYLAIAALCERQGQIARMPTKWLCPDHPDGNCPPVEQILAESEAFRRSRAVT